MTVIAVTLPPETVAVAVAPVPFVSLIVTVGAEVYPLPPAVTVIDETTLVSCVMDARV